MLDRPSQSRHSLSDAPPSVLVMLPGTLCDARLYAPVLNRLQADAVIPELAGSETAAGLAQLILAHAPPRISLCGFSLGAIVALEMVSQAPDRIDRLALIGCNAGVLDAHASSARAALTKSDFVVEDDPPLVHIMADTTPAHTWREQTSITLSRADSRPRLSRIATPTLVMCGARDRICPPEMSIAIADAIPGARLVIVSGAGHYLPIEQPETIADELAAWLVTPANSRHVKEPS